MIHKNESKYIELNFVHGCYYTFLSNLKNELNLQIKWDYHERHIREEEKIIIFIYNVFFKIV